MSFSMTFQVCLIKWLSNKSDFHINFLSLVRGHGDVLKLLQRVRAEPGCRQVMVFMRQNVANIWLIFHDFPGPKPDSVTFQALKI